MTHLEPGPRRGVLRVPASKSHAHRVLIAEFLAGRHTSLGPSPEDCDDVEATKRCLRALAEKGNELDCGESGTTRRLLGPVAAALGRTVRWVMRGRLASRPQMDYAEMKAGTFSLPGDVSSQFVSGLLFALPLLAGDSEIRLTTPLASRGYVQMTLDVLRDYGIAVAETETGFRVPGRQVYRAPAEGPVIETDWSGAAFGLTLVHLGNAVTFPPGAARGLLATSAQPDRVIGALLDALKAEGEVALDVDACPDSFPILSVAAAARAAETVFTGTRRLRLKESDRTAAMADVLARFGVRTEIGEDVFRVHGTGRPFTGGAFTSFADHRIAMSIAVGATRAAGAVEIDDVACAAKSYPTFFADFERLARG
ncbi:MAG: 3-phosphoshikimate 1-carboxyvinyltransferase [Kiritimatiellia bacterium]